ncbi:hypothetical protein [Paludisphaera rhizosphaerae]|uniref:hypothetical protein n=1 Tax=Paludisphaera rhizosphaerae TaxID=2711216 RepID=UPI0013EACBB4|nr:hypothetical protein [Paludisphaera rhizosphaerae]
MESRRGSRWAWGLVLGAFLLGSSVQSTVGQTIEEGTLVDEAKPEAASLHDDFEGPSVAWRREHTDTNINLLAQERSDRAAHDGGKSERFAFEAEPGSEFFVSYPLPNVPITPELEAALYVRSNRAGVQLFVRVVLPKDVDPASRAPSFVLVPGTSFDQVDRWQRLTVGSLPPLVERQARVLRASSRRPVPLEGAYIDCVVVNLMGGQGGAEVFLDDMTVGPVSPATAASWKPPGAAPARAAVAAANVPASSPAAAADPESRPKFDRIRLDGDRLRRLGEDGRLRDWFPTAVDAPGADVTELRRYGFDVLADSFDADKDRLQEAVERGFVLMPRLSRLGPDDEDDRRLAEVREFPFADSVAFWDLGRDLGRNRESKVREAERKRTQKLIRDIRSLPPTASRLTIGEVRGELPLYARLPSNIDGIAIPTNHWAAAQDQTEFYRYLLQRRDLTAKAHTGQLFWATIPTAASPAFQQAIWGEAPPPAWGVPRPLPEQIRAMAYMALATGYRGLIFQGDADLTRPAGRPQLIETGFLNEEIDLAESIFARGVDPYPLYPVFDPYPSELPPVGSTAGTKVRLVKEYAPKPNYKAAGIDFDKRRGVLLLLQDFSPDVQFQPPQLATRDLMVRASLGEGWETFELSPGGVDVLAHKRVPGGTFINVPEFGGTSMILCTGDMELKERLEMAIRQARPTAVALAIEQAELMYQQVADVNGRLAADGVTITTEENARQHRALGLNKPIDQASLLLTQAQASIQSARDARDREDFALAWKEARRAHRPLRILASAHWEVAVKAFTKAVALAHAEPDPTIPRDDKDPPPPPGTRSIIEPTNCPPLTTFATLPEFYVWLDWISGKSGYKFGPNRVPSGSFNDPKAMKADGWQDMSYQTDRVTANMAVIPPDYNYVGGGQGNKAVYMNATPVDAKELETTLPPFVDHPLVAIRSPVVKVKANNLIKVFVQVRRPVASAAGAGGIIVRDSIGGEQLQFRTTDGIANWSRVILYRKAPVDCDFTVTLGIAGYGPAWFDDFRVELVEQSGPAPRGDLVEQAPEARPESEPAAESTVPELDAPREARVPRLPNPGLPATAEISPRR